MEAGQARPAESLADGASVAPGERWAYHSVRRIGRWDRTSPGGNRSRLQKCK